MDPAALAEAAAHDSPRAQVGRFTPVRGSPWATPDSLAGWALTAVVPPRCTEHDPPGARFGRCAPFLYFGIQLVAAPFYPGYSFFSRDASTLGSDGSTAAWIFNIGTLLLGVIKVAVALAFAAVLPQAGVGRVLSAVTALALASAGIGSVNAFLHPLPDPRHTEGLLSILGSGFVLLPILSTAVLWRMGARRYAVLNAVVCLALIPLMTGLVQRACMRAGIDFAGYQAFLNGYHGLIQRAGAAVVFGPVGVVAHLSRRRAAPVGDVPIAVRRRPAPVPRAPHRATRSHSSLAPGVLLVSCQAGSVANDVPGRRLGGHDGKNPGGVRGATRGAGGDDGQRAGTAVSQG
jgi:hypothetical protein